ncbi:30S ribosomal protein THX [Spirosoma agri]|uniref:30S ribosomal protein THX n=1 Tax=Spirosoma agri TaxID=1987381 RepID=A0A6M0IJL9_9BACT|nr:30S ribosomal protein THX [Spirosoma agri]NEU67571.1 30S ribosomal protein THX [Spirosoma agri]
MGKGDVKSRKGKISMGSYGKTRPRKPDKVAAPKPAPTEPAA